MPDRSMTPQEVTYRSDLDMEIEPHATLWSIRVMQVSESCTAGARRAVESSEHCPKPHAQQMFPNPGRLHPLFGPSILFNTKHPDQHQKSY